MTIHQAIRTAREQAGLTRPELAERMNITSKNAYSVIAKYETGHRKPGSDLIEKISVATGCNIMCMGNHWGVEKNS